MPRPRTIAIGAFVLLLAAAPFVPRAGHDDNSLLPSGKREAGLTPGVSAGPGEVTPQLQAEIDRVVAAGSAASRVSARSTPAGLVGALVRCADFEGQRYCLHSGWTEASETEVRARVETAARRTAARPVAASASTGDLDLLSALRRTASLDPEARARAERAELTRAARSVAKVWLLRHQIQGEPLPEGFLLRHPEARAGATAPKSSTAAAGSSSPTAEPETQTVAAKTRKKRRDYPRRATVLSTKRVAEQQRTYWCGPTAMQMIAWGWKKRDQGQTHWARKLGTTSNGTAITDMVRVINSSTGWDRADHAGSYITLDIADYSFHKWLLLNMRHIVDYQAPVVLHPILVKKYYPYLDDDASGHFQVGRGYDKRGKKPTQIGYFEPWNQQRFDPSEPYIDRVQWRSAYKSYRANQAHFQHNIGV